MLVLLDASNFENDATVLRTVMLLHAVRYGMDWGGGGGGGECCLRATALPAVAIYKPLRFALREIEVDLRLCCCLCCHIKSLGQLQSAHIYMLICRCQSLLDV